LASELVNIQGNIKLAIDLRSMQTNHNPIDTMEELEQFRLKTLSKNKNLGFIFIVIAIILIVLVAVFCILSGGASISAIASVAFVAGIMGVLFYILLKNKNTKKYHNIFRSIVVDKMWKNIDPEVTFEPARYVSMDLFKTSQIFKVTPNTYKGENYIYKKFPHFNLYASELDVTRRGGGKNNSNVPVFNGIFFVFELNRRFEGNTLIVHDMGQNPMAFLSNIMEKFTHAKYSVMEFNNPEFEKFFKIYSTFQKETMELVQNDVVIQLLATRMEKSIQMSFNGQYIFIAIDDRGTFFQADPKLSLTDENSLRKYLNEIDKYQSYYNRFIPAIERIAAQ